MKVLAPPDHAIHRFHQSVLNARIFKTSKHLERLTPLVKREDVKRSVCDLKVVRDLFRCPLCHHCTLTETSVDVTRPPPLTTTHRYRPAATGPE